MFEKSEQIGELAKALSSAQGELEAAKKNAESVHYKYSDLATVIATAKPVLQKYGLSVSQLVGDLHNSHDGKYIQLKTILMHSSGQYLATSTRFPVVEMKGVNLAQQVGAVISYARRYTYQAILGMSSEDNDASTEDLQALSSQQSQSKSATFVREVENKDFRKLTIDDF